MPRDTLRIIRKGKLVELRDVGVNETLLDYLRLRERSTGTKEGCAEGDCGACTVAVGQLCNGKVQYEPINSCVQLLAMQDGKEIVTVDDLSAGDDELHPVQQALVDTHGSQCGFCTPGFVMSLFALYHSGEVAERATVNDWLAGNLCRCTGYRPIADAALAACNGNPADAFTARQADTASMLSGFGDDDDLFIGSEASFFAAPATEDALTELCVRYPDAILVAGATDVGLWVTKQLRHLPRIIHIGRVATLHAVTIRANELHIGAAATYAEAEAALGVIDPDLGELLRRLGSKQVRAAGTVVGNIANGSPIADSPPALIALRSRVELRLGTGRRELSLEDFFTEYGKQDRRAGEWLTRVSVPRLGENEHFRCYKISKRFDQDISAVLGAFTFKLIGNAVVDARIAYGGMAGTPKRARCTEARVSGLKLHDEAAWIDAARALAQDFQPLDDLRASAAYRMQTAQALLIKARAEIANGTSLNTRVTGYREAQARP